MGVLDAPAADAYGRPVNGFHPTRDLPNIAAWYDASTVAGTNGAAVSQWADSSPKSRALIQATPSRQPTIRTDGQGGRTTLNFGATALMIDPGFGADWGQPNTHPQPLSYIALVKASSTLISAGTSRYIIGGNLGASQSCGMLLISTNQNLMLNAGAYAAGQGGPNLNDDAWHVVAGIFGTSSCTTMVDGYVTGATITQVQGTNPMVQLAVGGNANNNFPFGGEIAEVIVCDAELTLPQVAQATKYLARKWAL